MKLRRLVPILLLAFQSSTPAEDGVQITEAKGKLSIAINGEHFCDYQYAGTLLRPFVYPSSSARLGLCSS